MKPIPSLSDLELLASIRAHAAAERSAGLLVIQALREVRRRRLDSKLGYADLHRFCMEELKYSSGSAWRRIKAMEALEDLPELEKKVIEGRLTLSSVSQVQSFCEQKDKSIEEKREIFRQVESLSKRKAETILASIAPLPRRPEKLRALDATQAELLVTLDHDTIERLDQIKAWLSHSRVGYAEVISKLAELGIKHLDPARRVRGESAARGRADARTGTVFETASGAAPDAASIAASDGVTRVELAPRISPPAEVAYTRDEAEDCSLRPRTESLATDRPQAISAQTRREVWRRDEGRCTYACSATGKRCESRELLQLDHIVPRAKGGTHHLSNLRLRCRAHNLLAAIQSFGPRKMGEYLRS